MIDLVNVNKEIITRGGNGSYPVGLRQGYS